MNLVNAFHTIQGEGKFAGTRALFIRMPFCNLKCTWCDTEFNKYQKWSDGDLRVMASSEKCRFAVITGGEPMLNKDTPKVVSFLKDMGFYITTETNGTAPILDGIDFVTCSPKRFTDAKNKEPYFIHPDTYTRVDEFKYVVDSCFDFSILKRHEFDPPTVRHSLSPEFNQFQDRVGDILNFIKENPKWRLSLQTHKWINVP